MAPIVGLTKRADGATLRTATFVWDMQWTWTELRIWTRNPLEAIPHVWSFFAGEPYRVISLATWPELGIQTLEAWTYLDWLEFLERIAAAREWEPLPRDLDDLFGGPNPNGDMTWL